MVIETFLIVAAAASLLSLVFVGYLANYVISKPQGNEQMKQLSEMIQAGARAFLRREYRYVGMPSGVDRPITPAQLG